jgi:hypothetical protein
METLMRKAALLAAAALVTAPLDVSATTLTFDDVSSSGIAPLPTPYDGFDFSCTDGCQAINAADYNASIGGPSGYTGAVVSGPNVFSTNNSGSVTITSVGGGAFDFTSADLTSPWRNGLNISIVGKDGATTVDTTNFSLGSVGSSALYTFGWNNVTSVTMSASGGSNGPYSQEGIEIAMDNLTVSPVPLPAGAWLLLGGFGALGLVMGRRAHIPGATPVRAAS